MSESAEQSFQIESTRDLSPARTCTGYRNFVDPMLRAAAAEGGGGLGADTLRWMGYADQELERLRRALGLATRPPYAAGRPQYEAACWKCGGSGKDVILASNGGVGEVVACWPCEGTGRRHATAEQRDQGPTSPEADAPDARAENQTP